MKKQELKDYSYEERERFQEELETYPLEKLEEMIIKHCKSINISRFWNIEHEDPELSDYLYTRQNKMNKAFEWTPENMEKLLRLNQKLIDCFEKIRAEAEQIIKTLKKRIDDKDPFLHDYEIEGRVIPFILVPDENGQLSEPDEGIERVLMDSFHNDIDLHIHLNEMEHLDLDRFIYLNKEQNWNDDWRFEGKFSEHFISQAIHELYDHSYLSFSDILRINELWAEVDIRHQHFAENIYRGF
jgi:hypothetical protein